MNVLENMVGCIGAISGEMWILDGKQCAFIEGVNTETM